MVKFIKRSFSDTIGGPFFIAHPVRESCHGLSTYYVDMACQLIRNSVATGSFNIDWNRNLNNFLAFYPIDLSEKLKRVGIAF